VVTISDKTLYDWDKKWISLKVVNSKVMGVTIRSDSPRVVLLKMLDDGFLTGNALIDMQAVKEGKIEFGE
jgi:hypothetical protein